MFGNLQSGKDSDFSASNMELLIAFSSGVNAIENDQYEVVSLLLLNGAKFNLPEDGIWGGMGVNEEGSALPLNEIEAAAVNGNVEMIKLLEQYDYPFNDINVFYANGIAIEKNQLDVVKYFLDNNFIDVNYENNRSLLSFAADRGNIDAVNLLLQYGAHTRNDDVHITDEENDTIIKGASRFGYYEVVERLVETGVSQNALDTALIQATDRGNFDIVKLLVENGATNIQNEFSAAAAMGSHILKYFIEKGADIDYQDKDQDNETALMVAATYENSFGVKALLEADADTALTNSKGQTALGIAKKTHNSAIIKMFKQYAK
jgi:ankyrin repeat protein